MDIEADKLPRYLDPLIQPTPSGVAKLLAAWDGLSVETQMMVLSRLNKHDEYLGRQVRLKALASENAYIRYLASHGVVLRSDDAADMEIKARIEADPDPLVRYSTKERLVTASWASGYLFDDDADAFWKLPHEARLAAVRYLQGGGKKIAEMVSHALDKDVKLGRVSEEEIEQVLDDYLLRPEFLDYYRQDVSGELEWDARKDIEALWRLVPKLPPRIAHGLIRELPSHVGRRSGECIPQEVVEALTDDQLKTLLFRPHVWLPDLRRKLAAGEPRDGLRAAAVSSHFSIQDTEFGEILALPEATRLKTLEDLAWATDLRLCVYEALNDYLYDADPDGRASDCANELKEKRLARLEPGDARDKELLQLRLYVLARQAVPVSKDWEATPPDGELGFLARHVVEGETWATFMAFVTQWRATARMKALETYLPRIEGVDPN
jgi:hypothetical protein